MVDIEALLEKKEEHEEVVFCDFSTCVKFKELFELFEVEGAFFIGVDHVEEIIGSCFFSFHFFDFFTDISVDHDLSFDDFSH